MSESPFDLITMGRVGVDVYPEQIGKVVTTRWPHVDEESLAQLNFPTGK